LARILYPELKGREFSLQFSAGTGGPLSGPTDTRSLLISVDKPPSYPGKIINQSNPELPPQNESAVVELPLYLEFGFAESVVGKNGDVVGTRVSCQPVKFINNKASSQMLEANRIINSHPEWTDAQDLDAARQLGMRFGPEKKTDLLRALPVAGLSSIYGPLQITDASFTIAGSKEPGSSFADLHWYVTAKRAGRSRKLQIMVEPFRGKIAAITE
jgi:hypothetical protein